MKHNLVNISLALSALIGTGLAISQPASGETLYSLTDLGTVSDLADAGGTTYSIANGINQSGQLVGIGNVGVSLSGFRTAPESPINRATDNLGTLGGNSLRGPYTFATGINQSGQVVGASFIQPEEEHAFRTAPNKSINPATDDLGTLGGTSSLRLSFANGINQSGQVVGYSTTDSGQTHAFRTAPESPINPATDDLGTLGGTSSEALGINQSGQVVGYSTTASGQTYAFRTAPNRPINPATDDLGTLGGTSSAAFGINQSGQVVGYSTTASGQTHAFRTAPNSLINPARDDLGTLGGTSSYAYGINNKGQVVGTTTLKGDQVSHAFLYSNGKLQDLNSLVAPNSLGGFSSLEEAEAINNTGQIVGYGQLTTGETHAFLATPVEHR